MKYLKGIYTLMALIAACLMISCKKSPGGNGTQPGSQIDTTKAKTQRPSILYNNYLVKKGSITINYSDSIVVFTAPQDTIHFTDSTNIGGLNYYSFIIATKKNNTASMDFATNKAPAPSSQSSTFPFVFSVGTPLKHSSYLWTTDLPNRGVLNITDFNNSNNILLNGTFSVQLSKNFPSGVRVNATGTVQLYINN